uniref:Uncharacterized protein n=1 Tax=Anguilla anguilla TaxID=7936 RepID=A0A0E9V198_ANGAN
MKLRGSSTCEVQTSSTTLCSLPTPLLE